MAKCPKCENDKFVSEKLSNPFKMVLVKCSECDTAVSSMEDMDLEDWRSKMFRNHGFFEQQFNHMKREIEELQSNQKKSNEIIIELLEIINRKLS
ncbi:hypothetical protein FZW96_11995 [Bacillus sp. BGMRC 2118]|nr:hypothetical protein FZW96_11995 [Bacillus sp. BGMRC 2118]